MCVSSVPLNTCSVSLHKIKQFAGSEVCMKHQILSCCLPLHPDVSSLSLTLSLFCKLAVLVRHRISLFGKVLSVTFTVFETDISFLLLKLFI